MPGTTNQSTGKKGENAAVNFLQKKGYKIIDRNTGKRYGEIDIVALDGECLVFVEVKTRKSEKFGLAEEAINFWKMKTLLKSINYYKMIHPGLPDQMRIDAVTVLLNSGDEVTKITHYPNITSY